MPSLIDKVRTALKRPTPTPDQLAAAVDDARQAKADAIAAVEKAQAVVAAGFMDGDTKRATDRATLAAAREAAEDASAILQETERRHTEAAAAEEQARRRMLYDSARSRAVEAAAALAKDYPRAVRDLTKMLRALTEAQRDVQVANAQLPTGTAAIVDPETIARGIGYQPREVLKEEVVEEWVRLDQDRPAQKHCPGLARCSDRAFDHRNPKCAAEGCQAEILPRGQPGWGARRSDLEPCFLKARFRRTEFREAVPGEHLIPLAIALKLPVLKGEGMAWGAAHSVGVNPDLMAIGRGESAPDVVLSRLDEVEAATGAKPVKVDRPVKVEWEMTGYVGAVPLQPGPKSYHSTEGENPNRQSDNDPRPISIDMIGLPGMSVPGTGAPVTPRFGGSPLDVRR